MYTLLQNIARRDLQTNGKGLTAPGLTYISVGHRPSLLAYHNKRLRLKGEDGFELSDVEQSSLNLDGTVSNL
jgi:ABC-type uncharacterized transport system fused permease/ATPase subunit